jgi:Reverse transcriptase (RNA-dependent DNA polymerase)
MNDTFRNFLDYFLIIYLDDFLVYSENMKEHKKHVRMVLQRMQEVRLHLKPSKCQFHKEEVEFLGFIVRKGDVKGDVKMDSEKVAAITE